MSISLLLLGFVGFCRCYGRENWIQFYSFHTPENSVEYVKSVVEFKDKQIYQRLWLSEAETCKEVNNVLDSFNKYIESDLTLLMKDVQKHLLQVAPPGNRKMRRCMEDIQYDIDKTIQEGVEYYSTCTKPSLIYLEQNEDKMVSKWNQYRESINFTLSNVDRCLEISTKGSEPLRKRCITNTLQESTKHFSADPKVFFNESKCMDVFKNKIFNCTSTAFMNTAAKKAELVEHLESCVGYSYLHKEEDDFESSTIEVLLRYINTYNELNRKYNDEIQDYFFSYILWQIKQEEHMKMPRDLKSYLQPYYNTLDKTMIENRSYKDRLCVYKALEKLNNLTDQGEEDFAECSSAALQKTKAGVADFINIVADFNEKLQQAGNVALLRCFDRRPQKVFDSKTIEGCAELSTRLINWERSKVEEKLTSLRVLQPPQILTNNKTCGSLRDRKLLLDADIVLSECSRCLYGESGDLYAVTTPLTISASPTTTDRETTMDVTAIAYWQALTTL